MIISNKTVFTIVWYVDDDDAAACLGSGSGLGSSLGFGPIGWYRIQYVLNINFNNSKW